MNPSLNQRECYIGLDIGGAHIKGGVVATDGKIWAQRLQNVAQENLGTLTSQIIDLVNELQQADSQLQIKGVGIGVPGMVSKRKSRVSISPSMPFLNGVELKTQLEKHLNLPVVLENDANVGAYGEMLMGAARGVRDFIYVTIGTRVGAALVIDRRVYQGASGYAGELGHIGVDPEGKKCFCGGTGCLERYVSASSIAQRVEERITLNPSSALNIITERPITAQDVSAAATLGDKMASVIICEVGRYLGMAIANLINLLNIEMVVLGGGVITAGEILLRPTIEEVRRRALSPPYDDCLILASTLGPASGVIGASLLARDTLSMNALA
ncbi:MAG: ROK family protein [Acidobacteriota bacterium]